MKLTGGGWGEEYRRVNEKGGRGSRRADAEVRKEGEGGEEGRRILDEMRGSRRADAEVRREGEGGGTYLVRCIRISSLCN